MVAFAFSVHPPAGMSHLHEDGHTRIRNKVSLVTALPLKVDPASCGALARRVAYLHLHSTGWIYP